MPPSVSVIVPCYNEQATIGALLAALYWQTYPRPQLEVVIADGISQDGTREAIHQFSKAQPGLSIRIVDNAQRTIPSGLNLAIRESRGEIIIRLDAHSIPIPEYVERCVQALQHGKGANVGGVWNIEAGGPGKFARGIAAAARQLARIHGAEHVRLREVLVGRIDPSAPGPGIASNLSGSFRVIRLSLAARTIASPSGCSEFFSAIAAILRTSSPPPM